MQGIDHAVVDGHHAAGQAHHVDGVALHVIVIVVFLRGRDPERIFLLDAEHGIAEGVAGLQRVLLALGPVLLLHAVGQRQLLLAARQVLEQVVLVAEEVELAEALLPVFDADRRVVDAAVLGLIHLFHGGQLLVVAAGRPRTLEGVAVHRDGVRQVDDLAHLAVLEQRGVALGGNLLHLPLHGRQQQLVFTRIGVGRYHHAVQRGVYAGLVLMLAVVAVGLLVQKDLVAGVLVAVLLVEHQSRAVVTL